nr:MAG TPA: hypothetical protein [Caudoviricetes sp.]
MGAFSSSVYGTKYIRDRQSKLHRFFALQA